MSVGSNTLNEEYRRALHHKFFSPCNVIKKVTFTLEQTMKVQHVNRVTALLFL